MKGILMKQITLIFSLILFVGLALVSCSDDDNSTSPKQNVLPESWPWKVTGALIDSAGKQVTYSDNSPIIKAVGNNYSIETANGTNTTIYVKLPKNVSSGNTSECTVIYNGLTMQGQIATYNIVYSAADAYAGTVSILSRYGNKTIVVCNLQFKIKL